MKLFQIEYGTGRGARASYYEKAQTFEEAVRYALAGQHGERGTVLSVRYISTLVMFQVTLTYHTGYPRELRTVTATVEAPTVTSALARVQARVSAKEYKTGIVVISSDVIKAVDTVTAPGVL